MSDTAVTPQTLIDNSLARKKDSGKTQWADAELLVYLNDALSYINDLLIEHDSELVISDGTITMVASTQEYTLDGNLDDFYAMVPKGVYFSSETDSLTPANYEEKIANGSTTTDVVPTIYYLTATKLGVIPIPTATAVAVDNTLNCRYFTMHTDLALDGTMPYKNLFNRPVKMFMSNIALLRNENSKSADIAALYNVLEAEVLKIVNKRTPGV